MSADVIALRRQAGGLDVVAERAALDRLILDCQAILAMERQGRRCSVEPIQMLARLADLALRRMSGGS